MITGYYNLEKNPKTKTKHKHPRVDEKINLYLDKVLNICDLPNLVLTL